MTDQLFYIHWKSGHREGWTPLAYTQLEAEAIIKQRQEADPDATFELIPAKEQA